MKGDKLCMAVWLGYAMTKHQTGRKLLQDVLGYLKAQGYIDEDGLTFKGDEMVNEIERDL